MQLFGKKHFLKNEVKDGGDGSGGPVTNVKGDAPPGGSAIEAKAAGADPKIANTGDPTADTKS